MTNLEQSIKNQLPDLMELGVGCEIEHDGNTYIIDGTYLSVDDKHNSLFKLYYGKILFDEYNILGKPITLPDVLRWLNAISKDVIYAIESDGCFLINTGTEWTAVTYMNGNSNEVVFWDLTIPNLSDQPQAVKDFLSNLIPKEKR